MEIKKRLFCTFGIFLLLIAVSSVSAATNETKGSVEFQKAVDNIKCRVDFSIEVLNAANSVLSSSYLTELAAKLQVDMDKLKTLVNSKEDFKKSLKDELNPDLRSAKIVVQRWASSNNKNLTKEQKTSLKTAYSVSYLKFQGCNENSVKTYGNGRITSFNSILENYQKKIDAIEAKGIDVSSLNSILQDAKSQIVTPLQSRLSSAKNAQAAHDVLKSYCLLDGCVNGTNFHLAAKFEIAKMELALNILKNSADASKVSSKITELESAINSAKTSLNNVGAKHTLEGKKQLFDNLKTVHTIIKEIKQTIGARK